MKSSTFQTELHDEKTFYKAFHKDLEQAKEEVIIESPFLTVQSDPTPLN